MIIIKLEDSLVWNKCYLKAVDSLLIHALVNISHLLCESFEELLERKKKSCIRNLTPFITTKIILMASFGKTIFKDHYHLICDLVTILTIDTNLAPGAKCILEVSASEVPPVLKKLVSKEVTLEAARLCLCDVILFNLAGRRKTCNWLGIIQKVSKIYFFQVIIHFKYTIFNAIIFGVNGACLAKKNEAREQP